LANFVYQVPSSVKLPESQLVVILVVQNIHQVGIEWVDVIDLWKLIQNCRQSIMPIALSVLDFPHVKLPDALNSPACTHELLASLNTTPVEKTCVACPKKKHMQVLSTVPQFLTIMHDCWSLSLSFGQNNINEVLGRRHRLNAFKIVSSHVIESQCFLISLVEYP
jgi:hypothetical protein